MSIPFVCECGRRYSIPDEHAGKRIKCKQCGKTTQVAQPSHAGPELDELELLDDEPPASAPVLPTRGATAQSVRGAADASKATTAKPKKSKAARLAEALPDGGERVFPILGAFCLVITGGFVASGNLLGALWWIFLMLATPVIVIWAGVSALRASHARENHTFQPLLGALVAGGVACVTFFGGANKLVPLCAAIGALVGIVRFIMIEKRFQTYSRAVAVGSFGVMLLVSATLMMGALQKKLATMGLTNEPIPQASGSLPEARRGFKTVLARRESAHQPAPEPPPDVFQKIQYESPAGALTAYLSPSPGDGAKHPAIVWITGGDCNTIDDLWSAADPTNEQSASAYRKAGIVMMFPSLRGGNDNPGVKEGFLGEVDDVLAAADHLAKQDYVDPGRIYLGGHSTGGTLVMLAAASTDRFRAVFSFGPVHNVVGYPPEYQPFNVLNEQEVKLRSPGFWLNAVRCPTFVFEGTSQGNITSLDAMARSTKNPLLHFHRVNGATHFTILDPTNRTIAAKILADGGPTLNLQFNDAELSRPFGG